MSEPAQTPRVLPGRSCIACRRRKIRCNRQQPCTYCTKLRIQCVYPDPVRTGNKQAGNDASSTLTRIESVLGRLESRVTTSEKPATPTAHPSNCQNIDAQEASEAPHVGREKLVLNKGDPRFVAGGFWADFEQGQEDVSHNDRSTTATNSVPVARSSEAGRYERFLVAYHSKAVDLVHLHPVEGRMFTLWQLFLENVDPLVKLLHVPTTQRQILRASQDLPNAPPAFECLMFSIYYAAIASVLCSASCQALLQEDRQTLVDRYQFGVEQALAKANLMSNPNVTTLQAFTLYLICARQSMNKIYIWSMTGLLIRLARKIGLHRDPQALGLTPFHSEMRRRLWWQIMVLDIQTAEDNDMDASICDHSFDTRYPANVNDVDLDINMTGNAKDSQQRTEMLFTLARLDVSYGARRLVFSSKFSTDNGYPSLSPNEKVDTVDALQQEIERKHLRDCDMKIPICFLTATASRMVLTKIKLTMCHPAINNHSHLTQETLQALIQSSIEILQRAHALRTNDKYSRWIWLFQTYIEWDAVAFLLHTMNTFSLSDLHESAQEAINTFFQDWKSHVVDGDRRWRRLQTLWDKAVAKRGPKGQLGSAEDGALRNARQFEQNLNMTTSIVPTRPERLSSLTDGTNCVNKDNETGPAVLAAHVPRASQGNTDSRLSGLGL